MKWMGMTLVTQQVMPTRKTKVTQYQLQKEHLTVATRRRVSVVKVNGQMHSNARLAFSFTVINSAKTTFYILFVIKLQY